MLISVALIVTAGSMESGARFQSSVERRPSQPLFIDAVAFDRHDMPVSDLKREDIEVWIAGYRVPVETFAAVTPDTDDRSGRVIVLVLDDTLPPAFIPRARDAARRFVNRMSPGDQMAIVTLNGRSMETTGDRNRLLRSIDDYNTRATGVFRLDVLSQHVLKTIESISRQFDTAPEEGGVRPFLRKTIVAIGPAALFDTPIPPPTTGYDLRREWIDAMRAMAFANVSLYVIDPGGVAMMQPMVGGSNGFARDTGGHTFVGNDLNAAADRIMREAGSYYLIGVADPPVQRKADLRELDVRVLRPGISVRARRAIPGTR
jgi:VWFA-related protein